MAILKAVNSSSKSHGALRNSIEYVLQETKTEQNLCYVSGLYEQEKIDYDSVYRSFLKVKQDWNKDSGRMYAHSVISFHKDEKITPEQALEFGKEYADKIYQGYQVLIAVHQDKEHTHIHLISNSVSYLDGRKIHCKKQDLQKQKDICNEMCRERSLTVAEKGKHFDGTEIEAGEVISWNKNKYQELKKDNSFLAMCGIAVLNALEKAINKITFVQAMKEQGWETNWTDKRKHITFENADGKKVRGNNLLKTFQINATKEGLTNEFERHARAEAEERASETIERVRTSENNRKTEFGERKTERRKQEVAERDTEEIRENTGFERENRNAARERQRVAEEQRIEREKREREERERAEAERLAEERKHLEISRAELISGARSTPSRGGGIGSR